MPTVAADTATLLVSTDALEAVALAEYAGTLDLDLAHPLQLDAAVLSLAEAEGVLEGYLSRALLVHPATAYVTPTYDTRRPSGAAYGAWLPDWPFVEAVSGDAFTADAAQPGGQRAWFAGRVSTYPTYFAGYRGAHHDLAALKTLEVDGETPLSGLTVLPPVLPAVLRGVILDLAYVRLDQRMQSTLGGKRRLEKLPTGNDVEEGYRPGSDREILHRAHAYRHPDAFGL